MTPTHNTVASPDAIEFLHYQMLPFGNTDSEERRIEQLKPQYTQRCPYCGTELKAVHEEDHGHWGYLIFGCVGCGWWCGVETSEIHQFYCFPAILARTLPTGDVPGEEIARALLRQKDLAYKVAPVDLEKAVAATLGRLCDCRVQHVGRSHDGGIDVMLLDGKENAVVQVKRRSRSSAVESVSIVREFLGAMVLAQSKRGYFVTTADHFSTDAQNAARKAQRLGVIEKMELVDSRRLLDMLQLAWLHDYPPWARYVDARQRNEQE